MKYMIIACRQVNVKTTVYMLAVKQRLHDTAYGVYSSPLLDVLPPFLPPPFLRCLPRFLRHWLSRSTRPFVHFLSHFPAPDKLHPLRQWHLGSHSTTIAYRARNFRTTKIDNKVGGKLRRYDDCSIKCSIYSAVNSIPKLNQIMT